MFCTLNAFSIFQVFHKREMRESFLKTGALAILGVDEKKVNAEKKIKQMIKNVFKIHHLEGLIFYQV